MAHKVFDAGAGGTCYVIGATGGFAWMRGERDGKHVLLAIDAETGEERRSWPLESSMPYVPSFRATRAGALVVDGQNVRHYDARTGEAGPRLEAIPLAVAESGDMATVVLRQPHALARVALPGFGVATRNSVTGYPPSFGGVGTSAAGKVLYRETDKAVCADDDGTLRIGWIHVFGHGRFEWRVFSIANALYGARPVDTREGPSTVLATFAPADGALTDVLTLRGRMIGHSDGGAFLVAEMEHADETTEVIAWKPSDAAPAFVVPLLDRGWVEQCQVHGTLGAAVHRGGIEVFTLRDGRILGTRVPQPDRFTPTVAVHENRVLAFSDALYAIDATALPFATEMKAHDITFEGPAARSILATAIDIPVYEKTPARNLQVLRESAERFGFPVPPLLAKMLELDDANPVVRGWIRATGLEMRVTGFSECWIGTDPAILGFAGDGSGQQWALYVYPPQLEKGAECGVVYWDHETREVSWCGSTFEAFLSEHLDRMRTDDPDKLRFLLEALGLPPAFPRPDRSSSWPPPDFFQQAHSDVTRTMTLDAANAAIDADAIAGERALVAYVRENENDDTGIATMELLYERLGWRFHRENLRQMKHLANR